MTEQRTVHKRALHKLRDLAVDDKTVILSAVQMHVMQRANEPDPDRRTDILHPSDMSKAEWCIAGGSLVLTGRGDVPIEQVRTDDVVWTRRGFRPVQHVTYMGEQECLALTLTNGSVLVCTPDHLLATSGGWLPAALVQCLPTLAAAALLITPAVRVLGGVGVPLWAGHLDVPAVVVPVQSHGQQAQVSGVHAGADSTAVIDLVALRNGSLEDVPGRAVRRGASVTDPSVAVRSDVVGPEPTAVWCLVDASEDVLAVEGDAPGRSGSLVGAGTTANRSSGDGCATVQACHVVSVIGAGMHPTYDIGVEGEHEFTANGVVVHNCWRHDYYRIINTPLDPKSSSPSFFMETIFEEGHGIHDKWQGWLHDMGWLYGVFQCRECHHRWWDTSPMSCDNCGSQRKPKYREFPLAAEELNVAGHSDGGIIRPGDPLRLIEVKSVSLGTLRFEAPDLYQMYLDNVDLKQIWSKIQRPFPSHGRQGQMYLWLVNRMGVPVSEIVFIYEWKPTQAVKEFVMKYSPNTIQRNLTAIEWVAEALEVSRPPRRPHWAEDEDSRNCKSCPYRTTCWKLEDVRTSEDPAPSKQPGIIRAKPAARKRALKRG